MDKHKILNPCDILTGKVAVDEFAKQFSDKIAEGVTDAMNFKKNDAEKIDAYYQYAVTASYAKNVRHPTYYVIAKSKADAKRKFLSAFPWLTNITSIELDATDTSDKSKYIVI